MKNELTERLLWEVACKTIYIPGQEISSKKALVRSDNGKLIGIRSNNYHPVFNRDLEAIKERILETNAFEFKGHQEFKNGKRLLSFFESKQKNLAICGETVKDYLIIGNSHDTSSKLFLGTSNYMIRCENQFSEKIRSYERRHDRPFNIDELKIEELVVQYELGRKKLYHKMERLRHKDADVSVIRQLAQKLFNSTENTEKLDIMPANNQKQILLNCIETEIKDLGPTLWGVFNGVTRYTSNHLKGNPGFGVVNGIGERMNREAFSFLSEH